MKITKRVTAFLVDARDTHASVISNITGYFVKIEELGWYVNNGTDLYIAYSSTAQSLEKEFLEINGAITEQLELDFD